MLMRTLSLLAVAALTGCGGRGLPAPTSHPVKGTVLVKGKPVAGVRVTFHPQFDIGSIKYTPVGLTGKDGTFTVTTATTGDGAPSGAYAVTFEFPRIESDRKNAGIETEVDAWKGKYADPAKSKWTATIQKGDNNLDPFRLD
jgi:hypothetical protein